MSEVKQRGKYDPKKSLSSGGYVKKNSYLLNEGSNIYRLLPPFGTMAETNKLAKFWEVWWMPGTDGKRRPIPSCLKTKGYGKNKEIIQNDPIKDAVEAIKARLVKMKEAKQNPAIIEAVEKKLKSIMNFRGFHLNVMTPTGEIGTLMIPSASYNNLKIRLDELDKESVDPVNFGPGCGIQLDFKKIKNDKGKYDYPVDTVQKAYRNPETGKITKEYVMQELDDSTWDRMDKEAKDINVLYNELTLEEISLIASLDPKAIDRVFAKPEISDEEVIDDESDDMEVVEEEAVVEKKAETKTEVKAEPKVETKTEVKVEPKAEVAVAPKLEPITNEDIQDDLVSKFLSGSL